MADYIITNGQLHSTDELMHWKYIKRERVNGKWRYYYDKASAKADFENSKLGDALGYDERKAFRDAGDNLVYRTSDYINAQKELREKNNGGVNFTADGRPADPTSGKYMAALRARGEAETQYTLAKKNFDKTPIGMLKNMKATIDNGQYAVNQWFKKLSSKVKKIKKIIKE